jgi:hypothetical protein
MTAQSGQKSYMDLKRFNVKYQVGDEVFLRVLRDLGSKKA